MAREPVRQNDFSFGELSEDHAASGDREMVKRSLKKGRNIRICNGYGFAERFGSRFLNQLSLGCEATVVTSDGLQLIAHIRAGGVDFCDETGAIVQSVEGAPWDVVTAREIVWHVRENELYVTHNDFWPRKLTYSAGVWSIGLYTFANGVGNSKAQLYYRFGEKGVTLRPSARTGTINLAFSSGVLDPSHVGTRFRWVGREVQMTAYLGPGSATGTVVDELPPTFNLRVNDGTGFRVGESVEGDKSGCKGILAGITGAKPATLSIVITDRWEGFIADGDDGVRDVLIGPNHKSLVVKLSQSEVVPAAVTVWDEQVFSDFRGYPGVVFEHAGRLGFADFPQLGDGLALSAAGTTDDFDIGDGTAEFAIFERIGQSLGQKIKYCVGAANLIILTDKRVYYVPESADTPLSGGTFEFTEIAETGSSNAYPALGEDGVVYVEAGGNRVIAVVQTGDFSSPWRTQELSKNASHLIKSPISVCVGKGNAQAPERYVFILNSDGTLAVVFYDVSETQGRLGLVPWDTNGLFLAMIDLNGLIYHLCQRETVSGTVYFLERFDSACQLDASVLFSDAESDVPLEDDAGDGLLLDTGVALLAESLSFAHLAGETVQVINGTYNLGAFDVGDDGVLDIGTDAAGAFEAGYHFMMDAVLWPPEAEHDQRPMFARRRISRVAIRTQDSGVFAVGLQDSGKTYERAAYDQGDDFDAQPPLRSEVWRRTLPNWTHEPCVEITRPIPHPVHILSVTSEVAY